mgnify:CR=1 FL=1
MAVRARVPAHAALRGFKRLYRKLRWGRAAVAPTQETPLQKVTRTRRCWCRAPYDTGMYLRLIEQLLQAGGNFRPFGSAVTDNPGQFNLWTRHDVDFAECFSGFARLLQADLDSQVPSSIFFRVDDDAYHLADRAAEIRAFSEAGIEVGLHSTCYLAEHVFDRFAWELNKFEQEVGIRPTIMTVHGLGPLRRQQRDAFQEAIGSRLAEFGLTMTDCNPALRSYDYIFEDCHLDPSGGGRFLYDDFADPAPVVEPGRNFLVLTHPCYWQ